MPDYRAVISAVAGRDQARTLIDGVAAANDLGLAAAAPARGEVQVDARLEFIRLGSQEIRFESVAPGRLYWTDGPPNRVVQAGRLFQTKRPVSPTPRTRRSKLIGNSRFSASRKANLSGFPLPRRRLRLPSQCRAPASAERSPGEAASAGKWL
jgi:hypothetical protein